VNPVNDIWFVLFGFGFSGDDPENWLKYGLYQSNGGVLRLAVRGFCVAGGVFRRKQPCFRSEKPPFVAEYLVSRVDNPVPVADARLCAAEYPVLLRNTPYAERTTLIPFRITPAAEEKTPFFHGKTLNARWR
jgi:hypothetical protein